jgi:hypothetical protein
VGERIVDRGMGRKRKPYSLCEVPLSIVKKRSCIAFWILFLGLMVLGCSILSAGTKEDAEWSINFSNVSISEALHQLTQITGIKIFTKSPFEYKISPKSYINQSIDQILKDILRNVNYAAIWYYSDGGLDSIGILILDQDRGERPRHLSSERGTSAVNRSLPRSPSPRQMRPRRQVSSQGRALQRRVVPQRIQEPSSGMTEEEGSEAEEGDEESTRSSMEEDDTSAQDSSDSQVEATTEPSEEEDLQTEQQNEDEESESLTVPGEERGD